MIDYILILLQGLPLSLSLTFCSLIIAFILAVGFTIILTFKTPGAAPFIRGFITVFTGTPLLVQIFIIYYGPGQFDTLRKIETLWNLFSNPWFCAVLALSLNSAAYSTQLFFGAVKAISQGQWQACEALGMSPFQQLKVLLPYALKRALSSYSNEIVLVFKSTSLAYTITLMEVMGLAKNLYGNEYQLSAFVAAGIIYLCVNGLLTLAMRYIERKALAFEQRR